MLYFLAVKTFVIGDIHGAYKALKQCLEACGFDYAQDHLIVLGDVCDGYPEVHLCIDELLQVKQCTYIMGNHDLWGLEWGETGEKPLIWTTQGGEGTLASYPQGMPQSHIKFLKKAHFWVVKDKTIFVHGGFSPQVPIEQQDPNDFVWDRDLIFMARDLSQDNPSHRLGPYEEIFVGHTPTSNFGKTIPLKFCNLWDLDTGAGWGGPLTIMDIETKQYWQSLPTSRLYPGVKSR
jgi:serine/threonine protein phosphatase 1